VFLADKSALARLRHAPVAAVLTPLITSGQLASCGVLELEVLYSARSHRDFVNTLQELRALSRLMVTQGDFDRAIEVMEHLARRGQHRAAGLPDLLLAAIAERYHAILLHYDADFDTIATVTGQVMRWVVPRGTVP
jgi:predicted nucleic acid-binding protein